VITATIGRNSHQADRRLHMTRPNDFISVEEKVNIAPKKTEIEAWNLLHLWLEFVFS